MLYLIAILLPPLAILLAGKPFQAILSLILMATLIGWIPASIWACFVVNNHYADKRTRRVVRAMERRSRTRSR